MHLWKNDRVINKVYWTKVEDPMWLWFSLCSIHSEFDVACLTCKTGHWVHRDEQEADQLLYRNNYDEWFDKVNSHEERERWLQFTTRTR